MRELRATIFSTASFGTPASNSFTGGTISPSW